MSLKLMKSSFTVLKLDKELIIYPLMSAGALITLWFYFAQYILFGYILTHWVKEGAVDNTIIFLILILLFICSHFIIIFFNTALISSAMSRFKGENPTLISGLNVATLRLKYIFVWSLLSGSVHFIISFLENNYKKTKNITAEVLGLAWIVCSYLVLY